MTQQFIKSTNDINTYMNFIKLVEDTMAGGAGSAFGAGVVSTETPFSGDNYAKGDARMPKSIFGGVVTRGGMASSKKKKKKARKHRYASAKYKK